MYPQSKQSSLRSKGKFITLDTEALHLSGYALSSKPLASNQLSSDNCRRTVFLRIDAALAGGYRYFTVAPSLIYIAAASLLCIAAASLLYIAAPSRLCCVMLTPGIRLNHHPSIHPSVPTRLSLDE